MHDPTWHVHMRSIKYLPVPVTKLKMTWKMRAQAARRIAEIQRNPPGPKRKTVGGGRGPTRPDRPPEEGAKAEGSGPMAQTLRPRPTACRPPLPHRTPRPRTEANSAREPLNLERNPRKWPGQADKYLSAEGGTTDGRPREKGGGGSPTEPQPRPPLGGSRPKAQTPPWTTGGPDKPRPKPARTTVLWCPSS